MREVIPMYVWEDLYYLYKLQNIDSTEKQLKRKENYVFKSFFCITDFIIMS